MPAWTQLVSYVVMWLYGYICQLVTWLSVGTRLSGYMVIWLYGNPQNSQVKILKSDTAWSWLVSYVVIWLYGYITI